MFCFPVGRLSSGRRKFLFKLLGACSSKASFIRFLVRASRRVFGLLHGGFLLGGGRLLGFFGSFCSSHCFSVLKGGMSAEVVRKFISFDCI